MKAEEFLIQNGILPSYIAFNYIIEAVDIATNILKSRQSPKGTIMSQIYPQVAEKYQCSVSKAERAIRWTFHSIKPTMLEKIGFKGRKSNKEIIYYLAYLQLKEGKNE